MEENSLITRFETQEQWNDVMRDFPRFIQNLESQGAHLAGIHKIIPPPGCDLVKGGFNEENIRFWDQIIEKPLSQKFIKFGKGVYHSNFNKIKDKQYR